MNFQSKCALLMVLLSSILTSCGLYTDTANQPITSEDQELYRRHMQQQAILRELGKLDKVDSVSIRVSTSADIIINIVHARGITFSDAERRAIEETAANAAPDFSRDNLSINYGLQMTLADVTDLSRKGEALTMADVREYVGYDPLFGFYGWFCEVYSNANDKSSAFTLNVTSGSLEGVLFGVSFYRHQYYDAPPLPGQVADPGIDIRYYDVMAYVERGEKLLVRPLPTAPPPSAAPNLVVRNQKLVVSPAVAGAIEARSNFTK